MNTTATIVSIIAVLGSLLLVSRHSGFREMGSAKMIRIALVWVAIILGLFLVFQFAGLRIE